LRTRIPIAGSPGTLNKGNQLVVPGLPDFQDNRSIAHTFELAKNGLDLADLDAHATQLNLLIRASKMNQDSIVGPLRQVSSAVHAP
jgi:hypothetical protein